MTGPIVSSDTLGVSNIDFEGGKELSPSHLVLNKEHPTFLHNGLDFLLSPWGQWLETVIVKICGV